MDKILKIIDFYGVNMRTLYVEGVNVGDVGEDLSFIFEEVFKNAISGDFSKIEIYKISEFDETISDKLDEYQYDVVMHFLGSADELTNEQQVYMINQEWDKLFNTIE